MHGESLSADQAVIADHWDRLCRQILTYWKEEIWNADEFGLFYRQLPGWTLPQKNQPSGFKKGKTRLSFLAFCNYSGSDKLLLLIIDGYKKPQAFGKRTGKSMG